MVADTPQAKTVQVGDRLIILNGRDPLMYVDLTKKKLRCYKPPFITRVASKLFKTASTYTVKYKWRRK